MPESISLLDSIVGDTQTMLVQSATTEAAAQARLQSAAKGSGEVAKILTDVAQTNGEVKRQQLLSDLQTMQGMQKVARAAGVDPVATSDAVSELITRKRTADEALVSAREEFFAQESQGITDLGLGGWFASRFSTMPKLRDKAEKAVFDANLASSQLASTQRAIQDAGQIYSSIKQPLTAALIDPLVRASAAESQHKAIEAQHQAEKYSLEAVQVPLNASKERLASMHTLRAAQQSEAQFDLAMANARQHIKEFNLRMEMLATEKESKEAAKLYEGAALENINSYRKSRGLTEYTVRDLPQIKQILGSNSPEAKKLSESFAIGELQKKLGMRVYGTTPADAAEELENSRPDLTEHQQPLAGKLIGVRARVKKNNPQAKPAELDELISQAIRAELDIDNTNIKPGSGNPRDIGPLENYIGTTDNPGIKEIVNLPVIAKVITPMIGAGVKFDHPKSAIEAAAKATLDGTITGAEFLDLAQVFQRANMVNIESRGYPSFGINTGIAGRTYHVNMGFGEQPMDVLSTADLGQYLGKYLTRMITARNIRAGGTPYRFGNPPANPNR